MIYVPSLNRVGNIRTRKLVWIPQGFTPLSGMNKYSNLISELHIEYGSFNCISFFFDCSQSLEIVKARFYDYAVKKQDFLGDEENQKKVLSLITDENILYVKFVQSFKLVSQNFNHVSHEFCTLACVIVLASTRLKNFTENSIDF